MAEQKKFEPFVSADTDMREFTLRALLIGVVLAVVLGAANAYWFFCNLVEKYCI